MRSHLWFFLPFPSRAPIMYPQAPARAEYYRKEGTVVYNFHIEFSDGKYYDINDVANVTYMSSENKIVTVSSNELLFYRYPLGCSLWFGCASGVVSVNGADIRIIEVAKV